ncbi:MAG TPA: DUF1501 domain-containing protein [Gemmataceae bacterium]|nr:DUF1501 domain-containing protein [Gemmataceae bacterium]
MTHLFDRRRFNRVLGLTALSATVPAFLHKTGAILAGDPRRHVAPLAGLKDNRVLVLVQLAGGNDGLNTLIPHADDSYYKARPKIGIAADKVLKLDDSLGLHPEMVDLHRLYKDGGLAVVPNVGYPNPNRSHFAAMDIWETASPSNRIGQTGWVGRYFDNECAGVPGGMLGLRLGEQQALTFVGERSRTATFANPAMLDARAAGAAAKGLEKLSGVEPTGITALDFVQRTNNETHALAQRLRLAVRDHKPPVDYPPFALCQSLKLVAQMIAAEIPTRVYYVTHGGFDTHSAQANRHAGLLQELSQALSLLQRDLKARGHLDRVLLMTFSEFGRRIDENRQAGTDHGTANVMFLLGGGVNPGIHGTPPDLVRRDQQGDLIFKTDFRAVYAGVLRDWLHADPKRVLNGQFGPAPVVKG